MNRGFLVSAGDGVLIKLRVSPGAKRTSIEGVHGAARGEVGDALSVRLP